MLANDTPDRSASTSTADPLGRGGTTDPFGVLGAHACKADVLVIEDDTAAAERMCATLRASGFNTVAAHNGEDGLEVLDSRSFSVVLLDWILPGCSGIEVLKKLRARRDPTPVFMITVLDAIEDRIFAFENGADDYLVKPVALPELIARLRARLRRASSEDPFQVRLGDLALNVASRRAYRAAHEIALTPREFDLLLYLVQHRRTVVSRETLGREVWRVAHQTPSLYNAIDVHIAHLRRKIDAGREVKMIHTVRGEGYIAFEKGSSESAPGDFTDQRMPVI